MSNIIIPRQLSIEEKYELMQDDAKYEVGSDSDAQNTAVLCASDIKSKPPVPKIPKMFLSSTCVFNCAYCGCRCSRREAHENYCNTPEELAKMAVYAAKTNGRGVFITSAIYKNADITQEMIAESVRIMREELYYTGFLHAKVMPGADPRLIANTGRYADRLSVNIEVARSSGYQKIAKQKNKDNILTPMGEVAKQIFGAKQEKTRFATSQTTQLMAGSTGEDDRTIMILTRALYKKYRLKRVYYTAFSYRHEAIGYEQENLRFIQTPYWRMARLYQADRLMQLYGFTPDDITPEEEPFLQQDIDPKAAWALRHLDMYPVEVNRADYDTLLRVPGFGLTYARRIIEARKYCRLTHNLLSRMKISLKKAQYFITCSGKYIGGSVLDSDLLRSCVATGLNQISITDALSADTTSGCGL
ncbi:MAG: hypothetical protein PHD46_02695 [Eubacteriales bacterium]|nr:hypothetical protein [Eubacteriales bacterium]MDD4421926.1 hypothetical protein [Eubacteriales bacterium]HBR32049.1 biotin synthase [Clostridiales bacterium]